MRASSIAKAISATVACSGLAAAAGAAAFGSGSPYRDVLIVAGIDAFAIGLAACILVMIFVRDERPVPPVSLTPRMRSLENPEGHELKKMLVRHVAPEKPVTIGFPCDDPEAEQFAGQIGRFLHESSFTVVSFAPEPPTVSLDPGIGIDDGNHILVGPIVARRPTAASTKAVAPAPLRANGAEPVAAMHASGLGSS